jgi:hypothetical protein
MGVHVDRDQLIYSHVAFLHCVMIVRSAYNYAASSLTAERAGTPSARSQRLRSS